MTEADVLARLSALRQHQRSGQRSPHKPLLVLFALGQLMATGTSALLWSVAAETLADLIRDYGPPPTTPAAQRAAYPFTGQAVYDLHQRLLRPRTGTSPPSVAHIDWHTREVFKAPALTT